ncbi:MAG: quinone-dependent dihydroorotate dehydrogenase [Gammaproteobacteria bacterium]|nr:quinone-dependent dihydroorotate dehydrogenase [Gammaproteobacteria bacterium]
MKSPADPLFTLGRAILFKMDPERAHDLTLRCLDTTPIKRFVSSRYKTECTSYRRMGLKFRNRVGLAAGLDKNGDYIDALGAFGFGFIEVGTVTPLPQPGNDKPRLFRLTEHEALINRMGFNNKGVDHLVKQVAKRKFRGVLGINIGKNKATPLESAIDDYKHCLEKVYPHADYITINISSPNTQGLRDLQFGDKLNQLLESLKNLQSKLATEHKKSVPLAVKAAPDMSTQEISDFCLATKQHGIEAIIMGNTTSERDVVASSRFANEAGGLSGSPLHSLSNQKLKEVVRLACAEQTIIGVGGIGTGDQALSKIEQGAHLIQLYSGLIYHGPALVCDCVKQIEARTQEPGSAF